MSNTELKAPNLFLDSELFQDPETTFNQALAELKMPASVQEKWDAYYTAVQSTNDKKDNQLQYLAKELLDEALKSGKKGLAGLLANLSRTLTHFSGYNPSDKPSGDITTALANDIKIPEEGLVVLEFFAARNLADFGGKKGVITSLKEREVDLSRLRIRVPKAILAAQMMGMNEEKKAAFMAACAELTEDQFIAPNVNHNAEIPLGDDEIAMIIGPRVYAIVPELHGDSESEHTAKMVELYKGLVSTVVEGGSVLLNLAYSNEWKRLAATTGDDRKKTRKITKLTGVSAGVSAAVVQALGQQGFRLIGNEDFNPEELNPNVDHAKLAKNLHAVKRSK